MPDQEPIDVLAGVPAYGCACIDHCSKVNCGRVQYALAELIRRRDIERRRDAYLIDTCTTELRHWDDELGWAVLLWNPDSADGEPPPPSFDDFSDRSHNPDYHVALLAELDNVGAPK